MLGYARYWWVFVLRGAIAVLFGILALAFPHLTLQAFVYLFGIYAIVEGMAALSLAVEGMQQHAHQWGWLLFGGILGIAIGIAAFVWPGRTGLTLLYLIAAFAILTGLAIAAFALALRQEVPHAWLYIAGGLLAIAFGIVMFVSPSTGALALIGVIGLYALVVGASLIGFGFQLRGVQQDVQRLAALGPTGHA